MANTKSAKVKQLKRTAMWMKGKKKTRKKQKRLKSPPRHLFLTEKDE